MHVEDVLRERVGDHDARLLAERMLEIGTLRARAARMLEAVYEIGDECATSCACSDPARQFADRGRDGARSARAPAPHRQASERHGCTTTRARSRRCRSSCRSIQSTPRRAPQLLEIGERRAAHEAVAKVLLDAADRADTAGLKGEILTQVR